MEPHLTLMDTSANRHCREPIKGRNIFLRLIYVSVVVLGYDESIDVYRSTEVYDERVERQLNVATSDQTPQITKQK